jgi:hypothetical protein
MKKSKLTEQQIAFALQHAEGATQVAEVCRKVGDGPAQMSRTALVSGSGRRPRRNFLCTLTTPEPIKDWSLTSLKENLIKIGAKFVSHGRYVAFQMAEVAIPLQMSRRFCA